MAPSPASPLGLLRIASPSDILRIGIVAAAGFRYSPVFDWERPYHTDFPQDTLLSYRQEFSSVIKSPEHIVLVATDKYDPNERQESTAIIPPDNGWNAPKAGDEVIVGVACWKLEPGSNRNGSFQNDDGPYPELPANPGRDMDKGHSDALGQRCGVAEVKYFKGLPTMEMVVVHPAYWKRGHGGRLTQWGIQLSKLDNVFQGVIAAKMGKTLYTSLGFENLEDLRIEGDDIVPQGVEVSVMQYRAKSGSAL
ncbi:hypothetical protein ACHAPT_012253 [Fusarium lateritium]